MSYPESAHPLPVPAGIFPRLLAAGVDALLAVMAVEVIVGDPAGLTPESRLVVDWLLPAAVTLMFWTLWQATPGKMMIQMRIVDAQTGSTPTIGQYVWRYIGYFVALLPFGLGFLWMFFDARKRGLHDIIAGTMVARTSAQPLAQPNEAAGRAHVTTSASPTAAARGLAPRLFPGGFGPWGSVTAPAGQPSLLWIRGDVLYLASVDRPNHPGATAAVCAGAPFPGRPIPLGALHSVSGPADSPETEVTFSVDDGSSETMVTTLGSPGERDELIGALLMRLGHGWVRTVEREARAPLLWDGLKATGAILVITAVVLTVVSTGDLESLQHSEGKSGLLLIVLAALGILAGAKWVIGIAGVLMGLCALYMIAIVAAPPERIALRRAAGVGEAAEAHRLAVYG
jgi:uncharacterized RDD family membrane protein YckC